MLCLGSFVDFFSPGAMFWDEVIITLSYCTEQVFVNTEVLFSVGNIRSKQIVKYNSLHRVNFNNSNTDGAFTVTDYNSF